MLYYKYIIINYNHINLDSMVPNLLALSHGPLAKT